MEQISTVNFIITRKLNKVIYNKLAELSNIIPVHWIGQIYCLVIPSHINFISLHIRIKTVLVYVDIVSVTKNKPVRSLISGF